jgi:hypothetical protein
LRATAAESPPAKYLIRLEYENPKDKSKPFTNDMEFPPEAKEFEFSSPDVITGLRMYEDYSIKVSVFENRESKEPLDSFTQRVRAYVDTRGDEVKLFKGLSTR